MRASSKEMLKQTVCFMKTTSQKLPYPISEHIKDHFREDIFFEVQEAKQLKGHWYYSIEATKDNNIHTLRLNEEGELIKDEADQAFPSDVHEGAIFEDAPEYSRHLGWWT